MPHVQWGACTYGVEDTEGTVQEEVALLYIKHGTTCALICGRGALVIEKTRRALPRPYDLLLFLYNVSNNPDVIFAQSQGNFFHELAAQAIKLASG